MAVISKSVDEFMENDVRVQLLGSLVVCKLPYQVAADRFGCSYG